MYFSVIGNDQGDLWTVATVQPSDSHALPAGFVSGDLTVWTKSGLVTVYLLFVMELKTRKVHFVGCTPNPTEDWMKHAARNLTDCEDGFLNGSTYLLMDRDSKFSRPFRDYLKREGIESVRLPPRSPNLNAHIERFMRSIKDECLNRMILFGEKSLRRAVNEFLAHFHAERNHQGLDNRLIEPADRDMNRDVTLPIQCRERLGGLWKFYHRRAA